MVFVPPPWVPDLEFDPPDSIPISEFMLDENYGRHPLGYSKDPFICGLTGRSYSALDVKDRVQCLRRSLAKEFGWKPNEGTEFDKVIGVFSLNTIDLITLSWAVHSLGGLSSPANAAYSAEEVAHQLRDSRATSLFTCLPLLPVALEAAAKVGLPKSRIYICELPEAVTTGLKAQSEFKTLEQLIQEGESLPEVEKVKWSKGEGARRTAFLCYSSGTSGLAKGVMISHRNVIANTMQMKTFESIFREKLKPWGTQSDYTDVVLGLLPQSHIYSLVVICHVSVYRGDGVVILPKFDMTQYLQALEKYKINTLYLVPPIIINMIKNKKLLDKYDLSHVRQIFTGAAPLGGETAEALQKQHPSWHVRQGYGLTETCTVVCSSSPEDIWFGSSGSLIPRYKAKLVSIEGVEITGYDQPGELVVASPSVVLGYLNNPKANAETFIEEDGDRWMRTGDEAVFRKGPKGYEHIWIVDRIKELIKVKGLQVAPAELEAHLLSHPAVADCAVIPVPDDAAGEVPKAFVVKSQAVGLEENDRLIARKIQKHVEEHKARHKWLKGGVEFIDAIPKSPSGKILRRVLRDKEREKRRQKGARL